jgi:hypothetical protein
LASKEGFSVKVLTNRLFILLAATACLPVDTSPPATVEVTLAATVAEPRFSGEWDISLDRLLLTIPSVSLTPVNGSRCDSAVSGYARMVSLQPSDRQRVALLFASGLCGFGYTTGILTHPNQLVLSSSVTEVDRDAVLDATPSLARQSQASELQGVTIGSVRAPGLFVEGTATNGRSQKHFRWAFWDVSPEASADCSAEMEEPLDLIRGQEFEVEIEARAEVLFDAEASEDDGLPFSLFAAADADDDGRISQAELERAPEDGTESLYSKAVIHLRQELTRVPSLPCATTLR